MSSDNLCIIGIWIYDTRAGYEELDLLTGHTYYVNQVIFSPDNKTLASVSNQWNEPIFRLWDGFTGIPKATLRGHTSDINSIAFNPDESQTIASASNDGTIRLWDEVTGDLKTILIGHTGQVKVLAFSPDGSRLASAGSDETIRFWDVNTVRLWEIRIGELYLIGDLLHILTGHTEDVPAVAFSPDGGTVAGGNADTIHLWDAQAGTLLHSLTGHTDLVDSLTYSPDGKSLASGSRDGTILLWDLTKFTDAKR